MTVSYFEWVQNLDRDLWSIGHVNDKLHEIMTRAFAATLAMSLREQVNMRTAAYLLAVQRVADATSVRGLYPLDCRFANSLRPRRSPLAPGPSSVYGWDVAVGTGGAPHG